MSLPAAPKVPPQVAEQAVRWLVELQGGADDERLRQAWQRWRQAAPEHEQAWRHIEAVNQRLAGIGTPLALAAINAPHSPQRRRALKTLLLVLAAGGSAWGLRESGSLQRWSADYATGVGERRRLALADGSRLELNSDTAVDVRFDAGERRLLLLRGEIQLSTGHDPRPLHVYSAEGRLRPVGTRFDVRQFAGRTRVAVHEGAVQVENRAGQGLLLPSGRQLTSTASDSALRSRCRSAAAPDRRHAGGRRHAPGRIPRRSRALPPRPAGLRPAHRRPADFRQLSAGR